MTDWIKWNGGECPIKSDKTRVDVMLRNRKEKQNTCQNFRWNWLHDGYDIISYRIAEGHEPKMTRKDGWIEWNGGECPIKSDKTRVEYRMRNASPDIFHGKRLRWSWQHNGNHGDIIAYRIIEDHEPMTQTREQITAQIEALQKQLDAMPPIHRVFYKRGQCFDSRKSFTDHYFDIETINGVPHVHGVAMKEVVHPPRP